MKEIFVLFGFDMETDIGSWTSEYNGLKKGTPKLLDLLNEEDIKATFFFTGESVKIGPEIVNMVKEEKHEIGCHSLFHETIGEDIFKITGLYPILPEEVFLRLKKATEIVQSISKLKPVSFRAPRLFASTAMINTLDKLGYLVDASYATYYFEKHLLPYHPSAKDWLTEGKLKILEIPNFADMTVKSKDKYGRDRDQWPKFRTMGASVLIKSINNVIELIKKKSNVAVICFYMHPWEFIKMPRVVSCPEAKIHPEEYLIKNSGDVALRELKKLIKYFKDLSAKFHTMKDFYKIWGNLERN